jgi:ElaB/YqjD/DUF883 family membrane-anchored ribosome-binding protein
MDNETKVIRHQMEDTRTSLTDKLETLEQQVVETVQGTTTAVAHTVENVKEVVQETVDNVKDTVEDAVQAVKNTFNISRQVDHHPWPMVGASVAVGYLAGHLFGGSTREGRIPSPSNGESMATDTRPAHQERNGSGSESRSAGRSTGNEAGSLVSSGPSDQGWLGGLGEKLAPEITKLKGLALGAMIGVVRDLVVEMVPGQLGPRVKEWLDNVTTKLGGETLAEPIFQSASPKEEDHEQGYSAEESRGPAYSREKEKSLGQFE